MHIFVFKRNITYLFDSERSVMLTLWLAFIKNYEYRDAEMFKIDCDITAYEYNRYG